MGEEERSSGYFLCKTRKKPRAWHGIRNARFLPATMAFDPNANRSARKQGREYSGTQLPPGTASITAIAVSLRQVRIRLSLSPQARWAEHGGTEAEGGRIPSVPLRLMLTLPSQLRNAQ